ncbi:probable LRR receptor-like serine/threonine-protein kinase [Tanacetum coccineum]
MWSEKDHEAMQLNHRWLKFCTTDLSFNFLDSPVPDSIGRLPEFRTVFLNNNSLSGAIPAWVFTANNNRKIDLSYNNFTETQQRNCVPSSLRRWAYSSNGVYLNNDNVPFVASTANVTGGDIYSTARLAPFSLRYYGLCLRQGSYKACSFMLCDLDFEPLSLSLSSMPSCDLETLTNILILCLILKASNQSLRKSLSLNLELS